MIKHLTLAAALCALLATARAEWAVGAGAVQLDASLSGVYDSNLNGSAQNREDFFLNFHPNLRYRKADARFKTNAEAGIYIKRYMDYTTSNTEDAHGRLDWSMTRDDDHTAGASLMASYRENRDAVLDVNEQVRSKVFESAVNGEVLVARRNLLSAGLSYHDNEHNIGSNQNYYSGNLGYSYVGFTDGTQLNLGYQYQRSKTTDALSGVDNLDQTARTASIGVGRPVFGETTATLTYGYRWLDRGQREETMNLGDRGGSFVSFLLSGPFLPRQYFPKTTGTFRLAYEQAAVPGLNDRSNERLVGELGVRWQARERTSVNVYVNRTQDLTINDQTVVNTGGGLTIHQAIGQFINAEAGIGYQNAEFVGWNRTDDRYSAHVSGRYALSRLWSTTASYRYLDSHSNSQIASFTRHLAELAVSYAF